MQALSQETPAAARRASAPLSITRRGPGLLRHSRLLSAAALLVAPSQLLGQWNDAQLPQPGELQVGVEGQSLAVEERFLPDGTRQPWRDVYRATLDSRLAPPLDTLDALLATFFPALGLEVPDSSLLGINRYDVLYERTRAPISLSFGVTRWLAAFAVIPIVKGQSFVALQFDTAAATAGAGSTAFGGDPAALLQGLATGISELESIVAADTLPPDEQASAEALLAEARTMEGGLTSLSAQTYVPSDSGAAGRQLSGAYADLQAGFATLAIDIPDLSLARVLDPAAAEELSSGPEFGIERPESRSSGIKLGDIEVGLSLQPFNNFRRRPGEARARVPLRLRLDALYRFASGSPPAASHLMDPGSGDGQPDVELRSTLDVGYGPVWVSLLARYNLQLETDLERLVTSPEYPIQLGAYTSRVRWDPGDVLTLAALPRLNFTRAITFSGIFSLTRHYRDGVEALEALDPDAPFTPSDLEEGTEYTARSLGFAIRFSTTDWSGDRRSGIPAEVELRHLRTESGRDGLAARNVVWEVGLRLYQRIFH